MGTAWGTLALSFGFGTGSSSVSLTGYLVAFVYLLSLVVGAQFFVLTHYVTRAAWSTRLRRQAENVGACTPLLVLLFLPIAANLPEIYPWAQIDGHQAHETRPSPPPPASSPSVSSEPNGQGRTSLQPAQGRELKNRYLSSSAFHFRAAAYFICWGAIGWWFHRRSVQQDKHPQPSRLLSTRAAAAPALIPYSVATTFAAFDWIMSLDPHWYSTLYGVQFFAGSVCAALSVLILVGSRQAFDTAGYPQSETERHDLGKLLMAFVAFWAYVSFSQYLLIWYANLPEETVWFSLRLHRGWLGFSYALAATHFLLPFGFLLSRSVKMNPRTLRWAAQWILIAHAMDVYWLIAPHVAASPKDALLPTLASLGAGAVLFGLFLRWISQRQCIVAQNDPRLLSSLDSHSGQAG